MLRLSVSRLSIPLFIGLLSATAVARADSFETYELTWSGARLGNTATATGLITLDLTTLPNPTSVDAVPVDISGDITSLSMTVSGSGAGDGTWSMSSLTGTDWSTRGGALDMSEQLMGQSYLVDGPFPDGFVVTWGQGIGDNGPNGQFNLSFGDNGPVSGGVGFSEGDLEQTDGGLGDEMVLTSFMPVPEGSGFAMLGACLLAIAASFRWKLAR